MASSNQRVAVIDLGTNTFHLLIVEIDDQGFREIYRDRQYIFLADQSISKISVGALKRAESALSDFSIKLKEYRVKRYRALGTAALRRAQNGAEFVQNIQKKYGLNIEIISGDEEASLIAKGTLLATKDMKHDNTLVMDIGGGSVEFILLKNKEIYWYKSFKTGISILKDFHRSDPISQHEKNELYVFLEETLSELFEVSSKNKITNLIGASGSFEVLETLNNSNKKTSGQLLSQVNLESFKSITTPIINSSLSDRQNHETLPKNRIHLIVVAFILMDFVIQKLTIKNVIISPYALKEGVISEYILD